MKNLIIRTAAIISILLLIYSEAEADIVSDIRNMNPEAAIEYPDADDIKQDILLLLYGMDRTKIPEDVKQFSSKTKDFLEEFNKIYLLSRKGGAIEKSEAVKRCAAIKSLIPEADEKYLPESDASACAKNLIKKFINDEAGWFENMANNEKVTKDKIIYYRNASYAYSEADNEIKKEQIKILADNLEAKYKKDMEKAYLACSEGKKSVQSQNISNESTIIDKINAVVAYNQALNRYTEAQQIYEYHGEKNMSDQAKEQIRKLNQALPPIYDETGFFLIVLMLVLSSAIIFLFERINEWKKAMYDVSLGEEVFRVSS